MRKIKRRASLGRRVSGGAFVIDSSDNRIEASAGDNRIAADGNNRVTAGG